MIDKNVAAFQAAEAFEIGLVNQKGFDLVTEKVPDLVILDMRLPGMNGFETFHAIHKIEPKLPVIIMTAYGTTETAIEATKMGGLRLYTQAILGPRHACRNKAGLRGRNDLQKTSPSEIIPIYDYKCKEIHNVS